MIFTSSAGGPRTFVIYLYRAVLGRSYGQQTERMANGDPL